GRDFFPAIDGGQIKLHVRAPAATRIEATERIFQEVEDKIREVVPPQDRALIVDDIGVPQRAYNLAFTDGSTINVNDGVILVSLKEGHAPTAGYVRRLREVLPAAFPSVTFYFQSADMITQILNFGLPAQIDLRVIGRDRSNNSARGARVAAPRCGCSRHRRCPSSAGARCSGLYGEHRSVAGAAARSQCASHRQWCQYQPQQRAASI